MKHLASITKPKNREFHFFTEGEKLYCKVDDDDFLNEMEYFPKEKWVVLKDFMKHAVGIKYRGKNVKIRKTRILGLKIDSFIINRIFWNHKYNIDDPEYTYDNYLKFKGFIKGKRGYLVKVCMSGNCGPTAILVSTTRGTKIERYNVFLTIKKALERKPRNPKPLIYHLTERYYFIAMRSESARKFLCYKCLTGKYYRNSNNYDLMRYGWTATQGLENYIQGEL